MVRVRVVLLLADWECLCFWVPEGRGLVEACFSGEGIGANTLSHLLLYTTS